MKQRKEEEARRQDGGQEEKKSVDKREVQMKRSRDPLPERKRYEQLCRGQGLKMVSTSESPPDPYALY